MEETNIIQMFQEGEEKKLYNFLNSQNFIL